MIIEHYRTDHPRWKRRTPLIKALMQNVKSDVRHFKPCKRGLSSLALVSGLGRPASSVRTGFISISISVSLICIFAFPLLSFGAAPAPTPTEMIRLISKANIFPPAQKLQARVNGLEALISTYKSAASKDIGNDCKIDSVLVARTLFSAFPDLVRVKVRFYDPLKLNVADLVNVTVGDVSAFSSGQTSMAKLLASLEVKREIETTQAEARANLNSARGSGGSAKGSSALASSRSVYSADSSSSGASTARPQASVSSSGTTNNLVGFIQRDTGLRLGYPSGWTVAEHPDAESLASFSTVDEDGGIGVVVLTGDTRIPGSTISQYARLAEETYLRPTKGVEITSTKTIRLGKNLAIDGIVQEMSIPINGVRTRGEIYYFMDGEKIFSFRCLASDAVYPKMQTMFNSLLLSVVPPSATRAKTRTSDASVARTTATGHNGASKGETSLYEGAGGLAIRYPSAWKVTPSPSEGTIAKFNGTGPKLQIAEMQIAVADFDLPGYLETHINLSGEQWAGATKDYKKISRKNFSTRRGLEVVRDAASFTQATKSDSIIQFAYILHEGKLYTISFVSVGWNATDAQVFFDNILSSAYIK